jgi:hypothetical protein
MARIQVVQCDRCKVRDDVETITPWSVRRGARKYQGDLCDRCWTELINMFQPSGQGKARHEIQETPLELIEG